MAAGNKLSLPKGFVRNIRSLSREAGKRWLEELPQLIVSLETRFAISVGLPFQNINFNFVAPAETIDGRKAVLKIAPPSNDAEIHSEARYVRTLDGNGVVKLLAERAEDRALLIERAVPGKMLTDLYTDDPLGAVDVAVELLDTIRMPVPENLGAAVLLDDWFANLERAKGSEFPRRYVDRTREIYSRLGGAKSYLHGDFHLENIVSSCDDFVLIDPKGLIGHIGFEIAVFLNNFRWWLDEDADLPRLLDAAVKKFSVATGISESELREWAYAHVVLTSWWIFDEMHETYENEVAQSDIWVI
ncbi:MAG: aminoglycoside phosphotransferase family protein [Pyrinomonadaceae bacterium]|nr:aminoglycoside phosphotransferase family protein [Pyrinomonadaceae bacterium]